MANLAFTTVSPGNTPLIEICGAVNGVRVLAKLETYNPTASVKDRAASAMIAGAIARGALAQGGTIIEATSGNTGIALAAIGARLHMNVRIVLPDTVSASKKALIQAFGAEIIETPGIFGMKRSFSEAYRQAHGISGAFVPDQSRNVDNTLAHEKGTGREIWAQTAGSVDVFVAGVGTGGTLTGVARALRKECSQLQVVAVEPTTSPILSGGRFGPHPIEGIGAGFVPEVLDVSQIDRIEHVDLADCMLGQRRVFEHTGIYTGLSAGANVEVCFRLAQLPAYSGKTFVTVLPDSGERYAVVRDGAKAGTGGAAIESTASIKSAKPRSQRKRQ